LPHLNQKKLTRRNINSDINISPIKSLKIGQKNITNLDLFASVEGARFLKPIGHFSGKDIETNVLNNPYFNVRNRSSCIDIAHKTQIFGLRNKSINLNMDAMALQTSSLDSTVAGSTLNVLSPHKMHKTFLGGHARSTRNGVSFRQLASLRS